MPRTELMVCSPGRKGARWGVRSPAQTPSVVISSNGRGEKSKQALAALRKISGALLVLVRTAARVMRSQSGYTAYQSSTCRPAASRSVMQRLSAFASCRKAGRAGRLYLPGKILWDAYRKSAASVPSAYSGQTAQQRLSAVPGAGYSNGSRSGQQPGSVCGARGSAISGQLSGRRRPYHVCSSRPSASVFI